MQNRKIPVTILGATGTVGQRFIELLTDHPWFEIGSVAASSRSMGLPYREACQWKVSADIPAGIADRVVTDCIPDGQAVIAFSGLDSSIAGPIEHSYAKAGYVVVSNSRHHRMEPDVPLLVPEINPDHLSIIDRQKKNRGYGPGFIVTNPNCSTIALVMALAPLGEQFGLEQVIVSTMQAISGAGYPGHSGMDLLGNVIPYIGGEEEKIESETQKILGTVHDDTILPHPVLVSASTNRVNVLDGHLGNAFVKLSKTATVAQIIEAFETFQGLPQELQLPSAPRHPIVYRSEPDRPQTRRDLMMEQGMATVVGRVRQSSVLDAKFVFLGHNTIRGAAGAAILNAELLVRQGWITNG